MCISPRLQLSSSHVSSLPTLLLNQSLLTCHSSDDWYFLRDLLNAPVVLVHVLVRRGARQSTHSVCDATYSMGWALRADLDLTGLAPAQTPELTAVLRRESTQWVFAERMRKRAPSKPANPGNPKAHQRSSLSDFA